MEQAAGRGTSRVRTVRTALPEVVRYKAGSEECLVHGCDQQSLYGVCLTRGPAVSIVADSYSSERQSNDARVDAGV